MDCRVFRREDGAEPVIGLRFARTRWRLLPGNDAEGLMRRPAPGLACPPALPDDGGAGRHSLQGRTVMIFILSLNFTDQGARGIKDAPKRGQAARELAKKMGAELKQVYLTTGDSDLVAIVEAPNGDAMVKFAMALSMQGNVHTRTARAWPMEDFQKLVAELP